MLLQPCFLKLPRPLTPLGVAVRKLCADGSFWLAGRWRLGSSADRAKLSATLRAHYLTSLELRVTQLVFGTDSHDVGEKSLTMRHCLRNRKALVDSTAIHTSGY